MSIITGDINKALGFSDAVIESNGEKITIDLQKTTKKDIVDFISLVPKLTAGKNVSKLSADDILSISEGQRKYFVDYFLDKDPSYAEGEGKKQIELFVLKNMESLMKEFTIGFGLKTREQYEKDVEETKADIKKKD